MLEQRADENGVCAYPPELDDIELIAAADGEASAETFAHLIGCPSCAARVQAVNDLQGQLRERLYRVFCPSSDELAAFIQGLMMPELRAGVAVHVATCPHCRSELDMLEAMVATPPTRPPALPVRRVIAQPRNPDLPNGSLLGLIEPTVYHAGQLRIALSVERQHAGSGTRLRGVLRGNGSHAVSASLLCNNRVISSVTLDDQGCFVLHDLPSGDVLLSLRLADYEVVVEALRFF